jgi:xanthine dehydrogenase accessory factor
MSLLPKSVWAAAAYVDAEGIPAAFVSLTGVAGSTPRSAGARMLVTEDQAVGTIGGGALEYRAIAEARLAIRTRVPRRFSVHLTRDLGMCCGGMTEVFLDPIVPGDELVVFGGGHVGAAVAELAVKLGFRVSVVDNREDWIAAERFPPEVNRWEADPRRILGRLPRGPRVAMLILTHDHALDLELVEGLIGEELGWLGMIGSQTKVARFNLRLTAAGIDKTTLARLQAPVGVDIGAESPEEIAVSIAAELVAWRRGRVGPFALMKRVVPTTGE